MPSGLCLFRSVFLSFFLTCSSPSSEASARLFICIGQDSEPALVAVVCLLFLSPSRCHLDTRLLDLLELDSGPLLGATGPEFVWYCPPADEKLCSVNDFLCPLCVWEAKNTSWTAPDMWRQRAGSKVQLTLCFYAGLVFIHILLLLLLFYVWYQRSRPSAEDQYSKHAQKVASVRTDNL